MRPLEDIERDAAAASEGPWSEDDGNVFSDPIVERILAPLMADIAGTGRKVSADEDQRTRSAANFGIVAKCEQGSGPEWPDCDANATFIAHARTDVPYLCARVRELEAALEEALEGWSESSAWAGETDPYGDRPRVRAVLEKGKVNK